MVLKGKKAQAMNKIVVLVIALVVLFVVLYIFRDQITKAISGYTRISTEAGETVEGVRCYTLLGDRTCEDIDSGTGGCPKEMRKVDPPPNKEWKDCEETQLCCEEVI